ncbi:twin-arginine translocation signal domain-containing protein [Serratia ureilytica]
MLSRRDILKVSAVSAAAAGMIGGIVKMPLPTIIAISSPQQLSAACRCAASL